MGDGLFVKMEMRANYLTPFLERRVPAVAP